VAVRGEVVSAWVRKIIFDFFKKTLKFPKTPPLPDSRSAEKRLPQRMSSKKVAENK
jgi:hypothetical protein